MKRLVSAVWGDSDAVLVVGEMLQGKFKEQVCQFFGGVGTAKDIQNKTLGLLSNNSAHCAVGAGVRIGNKGADRGTNASDQNEGQ